MTHQAESHEPETEAIDPLAMLAIAAEHITDQARRHPYRTLGIALGVGYVLGGGLPRFAVRMAGMAALRSAGRAVLTSGAAMALARGVLFDDDADPHEHAPARKNGTPRDRGGRFVS